MISRNVSIISSVFNIHTVESSRFKDSEPLEEVFDEEWSKMVVEMQSCWALSKAKLWGCLAWSKWVQISS